MNIDRMSASAGELDPTAAKNELAFGEGRAPRFSFVMIVLNGMPFIEYSLKSVYDFAYEIIVVEGAVENCMFAANADGSSRDGTVEFLKAFPDPQRKITLIRGRWPEKCEMQNEALKCVSGDYVWLIDSDEVYKKRDLEKMKEIIEGDPSITQVNFIQDSFWKGLDYIFVSSKFFEDACHSRRIFKYVPGSIFTTHRPPALVWPGSSLTTEQMNLLDGAATRALGITFYHYSYVLDDQVKQKIQLYERYGWGRQWNLDLGKWYEECFLRWTPENRQEIDSQYPIWTGDINSRTQIFNGTHPEVMKEFNVPPENGCSRPEDSALSVIGAAEYQQRVLDAWRYIKIDAPLQSRRRVMTENIEHGRAFWNIHVALAFLADRLKPRNYLEIGVRTGGSLIPLVHNCPVEEVVGVDIWSGSYAGLYNSREYTAGQINRYKAATGKQFEIELIQADSHSTLKSLIASGKKFSLITVDGDHSQAGAWEDLKDAVELLDDRGAIVFDDIIHPDHLYLRGLVERLLEKYPFFEVLINLDQDNGCAILLKNIEPAELLRRTEVETPHIETTCNETVQGSELPAAADLADGAEIKKILWVRTDSIGDAVLSSSMLPYIGEKYRSASIAVVCREHVAELYEACPHIDRVITFNRQRALQDDRYREEIVMQLKEFKPDLSLNSVYSRGALTDWFALKCGAKHRIAFDGDSCNISTELRDMHNKFYTDLLPSRGVYKLELIRSKDFLGGLGIEAGELRPTIWTRSQDEDFAGRVFRDNGLDPKRTIALFAGAQHDCRIYEGYGAGISEFCRAKRMEIIALGAEQDREINKRNLEAAGVKGVNLSGRTSILEAAAILRRCRMAVGAETGLAHICCAVETPNVILLGGGHFGRFMPYSSLTSIACLPLECFGCNWNCSHEQAHCVKSLDSTVIAEAVRRSFEEPCDKTRIFVQGTSLWQAANGQIGSRDIRGLLPGDNIEVIPVEGGRSIPKYSPVKRHPVLRPAKPPVVRRQVDISEQSDENMTIATSISPKEIEVQARAVESWIKLGFRVVSINCPEEIDELRESFSKVEFVPAKRDARTLFDRPLVYFDEFLEYFRSSGANICGIVNSDIHLRADGNIVAFIEEQAAGAMVYGSRLEIESEAALEGELCRTGFDFFFFDRSLISCYEPSEFCIGMPWWDYWTPLIAVLNGFALKRLVSPFAYHIKHPGRWEKDKWLLLAKKLFGSLHERMDGAMVSNPQGPWGKLGRIFSAHHNRYLVEKGLSDASQMSVSIIYPAILEFLDEYSQPLSLERAGSLSSRKAHSLAGAAPDSQEACKRKSAHKTVIARPERPWQSPNVNTVKSANFLGGKRDDVRACQPAPTVGDFDDSEPQCDVSIVICTKDRAELLDQMLGSLEEAASGIVYELIVVEGDSSDDTLEVLRSHNVWNIYHESKHLGPGRHSWPELYNFGFSKAHGKWAMYASDDIIFGPDALSTAVRLLEKQPEEVAGGVFFYKNVHPMWEEWAEYGIDFTHGNELLMNYGLIRLKSFREVGGLDEAYSFYCADTDLCYKLYQSGRELVPLTGCFVRHENRFDAGKQVNVDLSERDIELCQQRWSHFVSKEDPIPPRLLWRDDLAEAFDVPGELKEIDSGIRNFWHGLAFFEHGMFAQAEREFIKTVQSKCEHRQVLWHLALAADKCRDNAVAAKAADGVVRLTPEFEPALELLLKATPSKWHFEDAALCSMASDSLKASSDRSNSVSFHSNPQDWGGCESATLTAPAATMVRTPRRSGPDHNEAELRREISRFNKVVVWGLKTSNHTHAHIHRHFFETLNKIGARAVFTDDQSTGSDAVQAGDLVIAVDVASSQMPLRDDVYYCLHNLPDETHRQIDPEKNIRLRTYTNSAEQIGEKWDDVTFFEHKTRTLFQPWATDLLACEFKEPILHRSGDVVFWVGSIWDDELGRGNVNEIRTLKKVLEARDIRFVHLRGISDSLNVKYVRNSLIAPAIVGKWQMQNDYLPCRVWKNISYGQLGVSNVKKFDEVFDDCTVKGRSIEELIDNTLSLPFSTYRDMIYRQQETVKTRHTYVNRLLNIIRAFDSVENS